MDGEELTGDMSESQTGLSQARGVSRQRARRLALQALFEIDCTRHATEKALEWLMVEFTLPEEAASFACELVKGVMRNRGDIDAAIQRFAPVWPVEQLGSVDRNILRLGIYEIMSGRVPAKVAINEAVELAKSFGADSSPRFVNGVLGSFYAQFSNSNDSTGGR